MSSPYSYTSPHDVNCLFLSLDLIRDQLNEFTYDAELAGLHYGLENTHYGLVVRMPSLPSICMPTIDFSYRSVVYSYDSNFEDFYSGFVVFIETLFSFS